MFFWSPSTCANEAFCDVPCSGDCSNLFRRKCIEDFTIVSLKEVIGTYVSLCIRLRYQFFGVISVYGGFLSFTWVAECPLTYILVYICDIPRVPRLGFEPRPTDSESAVLPLHYLGKEPRGRGCFLAQVGSVNLGVRIRLHHLLQCRCSRLPHRNSHPRNHRPHRDRSQVPWR